MNNKFYYFLIDIINIFLGFLVSFALIGTGILLTTQDTGKVSYALILLPAPVISYLAVRFLKHIWSFSAVHLALIAAYAFTGPNIFITIFFIIYLIILSIWAFYKKLREEEYGKNNSSIYLLSVFVILYFIYRHLGITGLNNLLFGLVTLFILLYLFNMYLINFVGYFKKHSDMADIPIRQIKSTNHLLIVFFVCFCLLVMAVFSTLPLKDFLSAIGSLLLIGIRFLFSLLPGSEEEPPHPENAVDQAAPSSPFNLPADDNSNAILDFIQNVLLGLFTIAIIAGIIALVLYGLYRIYKLFYAQKVDTIKDITEFISPFDKAKRIKKEAGSASVNRFFAAFSRSNSGKIRKLFYKAVRNRRRNEILKSDLTPFQLSLYALTGQFGETMNTEMNKQVKQLTELYEKARYGKQECTQEDVVLVKKIFKKVQD